MSKELEAAAAAYRDRDFEGNPNGYTVAPYVNEETTSEAFMAGAEWAIRSAPSVLGLVKCIEYILQYDKNSPERQRMKDALAQYDKESGNG